MTKLETYKIKVLKDTPFDNAGTILGIDQFRFRYNYIHAKSVDDDEIIEYLKKDKSFEKWFEVIEIPTNNFRVGDWVWHEGKKKAFCVVTGNHDSDPKWWKPNYVSFAAANQFTETYKRKATQNEINYYDLVSFCDKRVLIGQSECYYFSNVWKPLIGVYKAIANYITASKNYFEISTLKDSTEIEASWECTLNGLKIGCTKVEHKEVIEIAKHLKLL
jgi:hypothetical protein